MEKRLSPASVVRPETKEHSQKPVRSQAPDAGGSFGGLLRSAAGSGYFVSRSRQTTRIATTKIMGIQSALPSGPAEPPVSQSGPEKTAVSKCAGAREPLSGAP